VVGGVYQIADTLGDCIVEQFPTPPNSQDIVKGTLQRDIENGLSDFRYKFNRGSNVLTVGILRKKPGLWVVTVVGNKTRKKRQFRVRIEEVRNP
jgi:hypothetical protein